MATPITQRELRNQSGEIMRSLDRGETFTVTRNGVPVGELRPVRRRQFIAAATVLGAFSLAPDISDTFRDDLDRVVDQDTTPRG